MIHWINEMAARLWPASLTLVGQAAVLVVVLLVAERAFRRRLPAAWAAALWMLVLVRLVLPPGLQSPTSVSFWLGPWLTSPIRVSVPTPVVPLSKVEQETVALPKMAAGSAAPALAPAPASAPRLSRAGWLLLVWGIGSVICLGWMVRKNQEVRRLVGLSTEASPEGNAALRRVAAEVGLRRLPRLGLTSQDHSPAVWGWFQPVILLPQALADSLSPAGLRDVLAHELIHLRRGDLWLNLPQAFLQAFWWWNPVVWLANARIRMWREQTVDDAVMALSREEEASYPQTLVEVARFCAARPTLSLGFVGILESRGSLRHRVLRLVNAPPARRTRLGWSGWMVVLLVAVLALPMAFARRVENGAVHNGTNDVVTITGAPNEGSLEADVVTIDRANNRITARGNVKMIINSTTPQNLPGPAASEPSEWRPWSPEAVENALAVGRPVLVLVTAKWDLTGRVLRHSLKESPEVQGRLNELKALCLEADWTRQDPVIEGLLKQYNRAGVPLVLWYYPGAAPVVVEVGDGVESLLEAMAPPASPAIPAIQVEVEEQGDEVRYRIQGKEVSREELREQLSELAQADPKPALFIRYPKGAGFRLALEVVDWARASGLSAFSVRETDQPFPIQRSQPIAVPSDKKQDPDALPTRWITVKMIEVGTEQLELPLEEVQFWASGGARVVDTGAPLLPWPSQVEGGVHLDGEVAMSGMMDMSRWKALEQEIESRPDTLRRVNSQKRLIGRQDWGLSAVDASTNYGENSGLSTDLISVQSDVQSNGLAMKVTVRPGNWSALKPGNLGRLPEIRRDVVLQDGQALIVACLEELSGSEGSPSRSRPRRPAKLIVLITQTNEP